MTTETKTANHYEVHDDRYFTPVGRYASLDAAHRYATGRTSRHVVIVYTDGTEQVIA
jgi:hypothetical protein